MSFEDFRQRAAGATLVPVWKDCLLDTDTPVSAFAKLRRGPFAFLLESAPAGGETWSRYTYLGTEPRSGWRLASGERWNARPTRLRIWALSSRQTGGHSGSVWGGVVGYFSYDIVAHREIPRMAWNPRRYFRSPARS
jgi:anthranilate synthase component 1